MNSRERRVDTRVNIRVPLRFRALNNPGAVELTAESENISHRGLYFSTNYPFKVGTPVEVHMKMPLELVGQASSEVKCIARVVHIQQDSFLGGRAGGSTLSDTNPPLRFASVGRVERRGARPAFGPRGIAPPQFPLAGMRTVALAVETFSN